MKLPSSARSFLSSARTLLAFVFRRSRAEREMEEELRSHLEIRAEELRRKGLSSAAAARQARLEFGGFEKCKEQCRDALGWRWLGELVADVRYGWRQLRRNPGFTILAALTLALGIGSTTAIFSIVDAVLLHGSPYRNPSQLVEIESRSPKGEDQWVSTGDFSEWQRQGDVFESVGGYVQWEFRVLSGIGEPDEAWVSPIDAEMFRLLGVNASLGRTFAADDTQTAILSHVYWLSHFAGDSKIIGKTLALDGKPYTVIGVAPADFEFPSPNTQLWVPLQLTAAEKNDHEHHRISVVARLKPGITLKQAQAAMDITARRLAAQYPKEDAGWTAPVRPLRPQQITPVLRTAIVALLAAVVFVLMIAIANVTSMLLARGTTRQSEVAIRTALGAGRFRLIRQLVVESILLTGGASVLGLLLASWGLKSILKLLPKYSLVETQAVHRVSMNLPVLAFTVALALLTGTVVGLLPALRISGVSLNEWLKQRGRPAGGSARGLGVQRVLIVCQATLTLVLLIGAALMIQSFEHLQSAPIGFEPDHLLTVRVPLVSYKYAQGPKSAAFYDTVLERIRAIPGVRAAGMANNLPFTGFATSVDLQTPPNSAAVLGHTFYVAARSVSPGYFHAMGIRLKAGRDFTAADNRKDAPCVRIVNETFARLYWSGQDPVGQVLSGTCPNKTGGLIVGVVADSKQGAVDAEVEPEIYHPYAQMPSASFLVTFVVRTSANPTAVAAAVRRAVWDVDHDQPVIQVRTMENVIAESIWQQHVSASVLGIFAVIALVLSAAGIYGVFSYSVSQRTHEIGIRTALGAAREDILRMVLKEGLVLILAGLGAGSLAAIALTRLLGSLLYGVRPRDPLTFIGIAILLTGVALLACFIPARRAAKIDPMVALRYE